MSDALYRLTVALGHQYEIDRELGEGGMATVHLARDLRHNRQVAIKVLRPELAAVIGGERFLKEIEVTANLQHPNILPLYDSGQADDFLYYVMPYVEGESLRDRLNREKQLGVGEAVEIARAVLNALSFAHSRGVIHRDIKPENILFQGGQAIVADFGIALAVSQVGGTRLTETGLSIGTPQYMSPEQATGERHLDGRTDVYALGAVLYEMLAGVPPHAGPSAQAVIASVLSKKPAMLDTRRDTVPHQLADAVNRALQKLPADRFASAAEFAAALAVQPPVTGAAGAAVRTVAPGGRWIGDWRSRAAVAALLVSVAYAFWPRVAGPGNPAPVARFVVPLPEDGGVASGLDRAVAISPDGTLLAYVGGAGRSDSGTSRLYVRAFDRIDPSPLEGTENARAPFFSPDGTWIAFYVGTRIRKVPVTGGPTATIAEGARTFMAGAAWLDDNSIVFPSAFGELTRVQADGTGREVVFRDTTAFVAGPTGIPSGSVVMWYCPVVTCIESEDLVALDLTTGVIDTLLEGFGRSTPERTSVVSYLSGHLVLTKPEDPSLWVATLDADGGRVLDTPRAVLEGVVTGRGFAVSRTGTLVYLTGASGSRLVLVDRSGKASPITDRVKSYLFPRFSPDGTKIAVEIHDEHGGQIWLHDRTSGTLTRLTSEGHNTQAAFSPDGRWVVYASGRDTLGGLYAVSVDRSEPEHAVVGGVRYIGTNPAWSPDGQWLMMTDYDQYNSEGVFVVAAHDSSAPRALLSGEANEDGAVFSPDGEWIAFVSDESGQNELYVRRFAGPSGQWAISSGGGSEPAWPAPGDQIYYRGTDGLYAARVALDPGPRVISRTRLFSLDGFASVRWDVRPDGRDFVMVQEVEEHVQLVVVMNWLEELMMSGN